MGIGQVCALGHEHDVGESDQAAAQADGRPVDRGHDRDPVGHHAGDDLTAVGQGLLATFAVAGQLVEVGEVTACREGSPVAGQHGGTGPLVGVDLGEQSGQPLV